MSAESSPKIVIVDESPVRAALLQPWSGPHSAPPNSSSSRKIAPQMIRWGQTSLSAEAVHMAVFRPELYDAALGRDRKGADAVGAIGAFAGPAFDPKDVRGHLASFAIGRQKP